MYANSDLHTASRFIQKQGLDRTFVECDNHMWRVDNRKLPGDITVDGGSDWIAIHRNYSRYLVTDRSLFLTGLKRYYEFSLLPAEVHVYIHVCVYLNYHTIRNTANLVITGTYMYIDAVLGVLLTNLTNF